MLSRIAQELFWLGRNVARAEHTARMLDGVFQASLQSSAYSTSSASATVQLDWGSIVSIMGAVPDESEGSSQVLRRMTLDRNEPASLISCIDRAREGARTVRDVVSAEMWEAINTTQLTLAQVDLQGQLNMGPYSVFQYVRERSATFWGLTSRTMLRDDASAFLTAGGRIESADMVLRMLRVAMPDAPQAEAPEGPELAVEDAGLQDAQAQALLHAVGGFQRSAAQSPPPRTPVPSRGSCSMNAPTPTRWRRRSMRCSWRSPAPTRCRAALSRYCASAASAPTSTSAAARRRWDRPSARSPRRASACRTSSSSSTATSPSATSPAPRRPLASSSPSRSCSPGRP